jgi:hypothetical protein
MTSGETFDRHARRCEHVGHRLQTARERRVGGIGGAPRPDHEVAAAVVADDAGLGHRRGDVDDRRHDERAHVPGDRRRVLDAVLQAEDERAVGQVRRHRRGDGVGVGRT